MLLRNALYLLVFTLTCALWTVRAQDASFAAVDLDATLGVDKLAGQVASKRVVFIGETHDRYDHHLNQLAILKRLYQLDSNLSIGVEYLQQRVQPQVDDYIAGKTTEQEFLRAAEYYQSWGYDYRMYAPIFRFARENRIPLRALNVPTGLTSAVAKNGIAGLSAEQRAELPKDMGTADEDYKSRLRVALQAHGPTKPADFDHFVEAQLVWDEGMAEGAATYLNANPERRMVILAGSGHLEYGSGIPKRLEHRINSASATYSIVLNSSDDPVEQHIADYLLLTKKQNLPPAGVLGISLEAKDGDCRIRAVNPGSAGEKAGLKKGDVLTQIDGQPIKKIADMRLALWDKKPGDRVQIGLRRKHHVEGTNTESLDVELAAPAPKPPGKP